MKLLTAFCLLAGLAGAAPAESWTVKMQAVNGKVTYTHTQALRPGKQDSYVGKARRRGMGPEREIIFNTYLHDPEEGALRLDYQVEVAGEQQARPPFQAQGKVLLRPGKPVLAAEAGGWRLVLELQGEAEGKGGSNSGVLEALLKCGRTSYPAKFAYLPNEQYTAVLFWQEGDTARKFMVGLLPNASALDEDFNLQYTFLLREGGETLAEGQGELVLTPGGSRRGKAAGKDCTFSARATR
jgi:hypothetical protein